MDPLQRLVRSPLCWFGMHVQPEARYPHGPVVAECPCCGKTCYFYGLSAYGLGGPPILMPITLKAVPQKSG